MRNDRLPRAWLAAATALAVAAVGCGDSATVREAKTKLVETMGSDDKHAAYALALLSNGSSGFSQEMLVQSIGSDHYPTALEAVRQVVADPPPAAEEALRATFAGKRGVLKLNAAIALARLGDEPAMGFVREEALERGGLTQAAAMLLAERDAGEELKPILAERLESSEPSIRAEAYAVLGAVRQPWATQMVIEALADEFGEDRIPAIRALGDSRDAAALAAVRQHLGTKDLVQPTLVALGQIGDPQPLPEVKKLLEHDDESIRVHAATTAWRLGDEAAALETIAAVRGSEDPGVRAELAEQLAGIEADAAAELLHELMADEDAAVRVAAVRSLAELARPDLTPWFVEVLDDPSYEVSTSALDALARFGGGDSMASISPLLDHKIPYVAMSAAIAVVEIHDRGAAGGA